MRSGCSGYDAFGDYGGEPDASFMQCEEGERIIRDCVRQDLLAAVEIAQPVVAADRAEVANFDHPGAEVLRPTDGRRDALKG